MDRLLIRVEKDLANRDLWAEIHGKIHSIKGMARALSLNRISDLSHDMENWCKTFQQGTMTATPNAVQLLVDGADLLRFLVEKKGEMGSVEDQRWHDTLASKFRKSPAELTSDVHPEKPASTSTLSSTERIDYVRVKYSLIEELLGLSQEILFLEKKLPPLPQEHVESGLKNWIDGYTSMLKGLHFRLAQLRLVSVGDFADIFVKTIRNLAKENNKEVRFEVIGGDLEADITLLERLREPFIHIFRNSITHGIEPPDERKKAGKNAEGKIVLNASRKRDNLFIKISDDGRGINRSAIIRYLNDKRSMTEKQIEQLPPEQFFDTIYSPDFSSATGTTAMAGRGIGMNVVAQAIEHLGGTITIHSEASRGTELGIILPVSLAILYTVIFKIGEYTLSIPTSTVLSIDRTEQISPEDKGSFYDLRRLWGIKENGRRSFHILRIRPPDEKDSPHGKDGGLELLVDDIIGNKPIMVMPVGELLAKAGLFAGVGIMENGDISILLDIGNLPVAPRY